MLFPACGEVPGEAGGWGCPRAMLFPACGEVPGEARGWGLSQSHALPRLRGSTRQSQGMGPVSQAEGVIRLIRILVTPLAELETSVPSTRLSLLRLNVALKVPLAVAAKVIVQSPLLIMSAK